MIDVREASVRAQQDVTRTPDERFEDFFRATYEPVLQALYLVAGDLADAEDAAQEAFVRIYERWPAVAAGPNPAGYAYRTALNVHRSHARRLRLASRRLFVPNPSDSLREVDDRDELRRALAKLPRAQREALILVEWVGMKDEEVGHVLRIKPGAVRVRLSRARKRLRGFIGDAKEDV
jgi:RNA polymerase sigma-70 factor (ECF subfamily)